MSDATLPGVRAALVDPGGTTSRPFYAFFQSQATNLSALSDRVSVIESTPSNASNLSPNANVIGAYSIAVQGTLRTGIVRVLLEGDVEFAGATNYYGSDSTGAKGWYAISDALADSANIIKSVDTGGVTSFDLSDVTVGSGGTLQKYGFDAKGRLNNQSAATTSDLAEGSNLYFTAARVLSTVLAGLSTASSSVITAADSVLSSFGKLQAQISAVVTSLAGYVQTTRTISTTAPLTGGGDLSANRTLAIPAATTSVGGYLTSTDWNTFNGKQPGDATLTALAGANWVANSLPIGSGADTVSQVSFAANTFPARASTGNLVATAITDFGLSLVDDVSAAAARTTLGALSNAGDTGTGNYSLLGDATFGLAAGGSVTTFNRPGSTAAGSSIQFSSPGGVAGIIGFTGAASRCDLRFAGNLMQFGVSATSSAPSIQLEVSPTSARPGADNAYSLGESSRRWSVVYAATGAINTSDAREKTDVTPLTAEELAAAADLARSPGTYQWLSAVQAKGADARKHAGLTVQRAIEIMQAHGLDPFAYGFICYDQWDETPESADPETGEVTQAYMPSGDRYSFRHDELLLFITRGFAARLDALEATLAA